MDLDSGWDVTRVRLPYQWTLDYNFLGASGSRSLVRRGIMPLVANSSPLRNSTLPTGDFWTGIVSECPVIRIPSVEISDSTDETGLGYSCFNISSMVTISASPEQP